ncbi:MerC domain-containing protein [Polaribacter sargassicola]|uniref:MerC domain-containing protein n=1 Tax=Polaribacter sargassicola TaxID=2836891 RepID=UPI001F429057|nr:MerC domain-containing protein [Polaribacter sp. DS7-9]MCG1036819.1 MerC family mercury resistance protein [Polaribacter sp. DS7-9]
MIFTKQKADSIGAISSTLCLIHCVATPFIFLAQSSLLNCCNEVPSWWKLFDYFFLIISFFAVIRTTQTTTKQWVKTALWFSWAFLFTVIINEKFELLSLNENIIFIPTISLIYLHLYNRKYCQCNTDKCCTHEG